MKTIRITDISIRECENNGNILSFKEKVEMAKVMDRLNYSSIELPALTDKRGDELLVKSIASTIQNSETSISAELTKAGVERAWDCICKAKKPVIVISVPVSAVQMEYVCNKKAPAVKSMIAELVGEAVKICPKVEFAAKDATRAEFDFLCECIREAVKCGVKKVTLCDTAGVMLPEDAAGFVKSIVEEIPELKDVCLCAEFSNELDMSTACAFAAVTAGVCEIKTTINGKSFPQIENIVKVIDKKGEAQGYDTCIVKTELSRAVNQMMRIAGSAGNPVLAAAVKSESDDSMSFDINDDITVITDACKKLGYDLSKEDAANVFEGFMRVATKKEKVTGRELEAIVASSALQVPPTYKLENYVINSGNIIVATANIVMKKGEDTVTGISTGDGPIDAAFKAIESILGHHYELDDFRVSSVTEGREATGQAIVKLRANGTLYSGNGISTDIIGAAIRAYVNAVNKIVYTEA